MTMRLLFTRCRHSVLVQPGTTGFAREEGTVNQFRCQSYVGLCKNSDSVKIEHLWSGCWEPVIPLLINASEDQGDSNKSLPLVPLLPLAPLAQRIAPLANQDYQNYNYQDDPPSPLKKLRAMQDYMHDARAGLARKLYPES